MLAFRKSNIDADWKKEGNFYELRTFVPIAPTVRPLPFQLNFPTVTSAISYFRVYLKNSLGNDCPTYITQTGVTITYDSNLDLYYCDGSIDYSTALTNQNIYEIEISNGTDIWRSEPFRVLTACDTVGEGGYLTLEDGGIILLETGEKILTT